MNPRWPVIFTALTTKSHDAATLDLSAKGIHIGRQIAAGVRGMIVLGSIGKNSSLSPSGKEEIVHGSRVLRNIEELLQGTVTRHGPTVP